MARFPKSVYLGCLSTVREVYLGHSLMLFVRNVLRKKIEEMKVIFLSEAGLKEAGV